MFCSSDVSDVFLQSIFQGLMKKKSYKIYICFKNFSAYDIKQNSTWRELFATQLALQSFASKINNESVRLMGLNQYNTQILVCCLDIPENNSRNRIDCFSLYQLAQY